MEYLTSVPDIEFFDSVLPDSLVMIDDMWSECCLSDSMIKAYKVFSRKMKLSIIIVSQSYFGGGQGGRELRKVNYWNVC